MSRRPPPAPRRRRRTPEPADASTTVRPSRREAAEVVDSPAAGAPSGPPEGDELDAAILRVLRRWPNQTVDLAPLAEELGIDSFALQLAVERLHRRRMVVAPFIEPSRAGGATLSEVGLRWLIAHEGGKPKDVPTAFKLATERVRAEDEAARLPRAQVYGVRRPQSGTGTST